MASDIVSYASLTDGLGGLVEPPPTCQHQRCWVAYCPPMPDEEWYARRDAAQAVRERAGFAVPVGYERCDDDR